MTSMYFSVLLNMIFLTLHFNQDSTLKLMGFQCVFLFFTKPSHNGIFFIIKQKYTAAVRFLARPIFQTKTEF